jgi:oxygen-dependent protoporphyrinogen oxidase
LSSNSNIVIIGGGISGLSTAYYLSKAGLRSTLIEKRSRLGGVIQTEHIEGCVLEAGPDSFISIKPAAAELVHEVGLGDDLIGSNDHLRVTYIWKNGRLVALPDGLMMMVPTRIRPLISTPLLGWSTKFRMGLEYFRQPPAGPHPDRSVAEFITDHYGSESLDYLTEPLLSGVYGGDPARLSAASVLTRFVELEGKYGSITRGVLSGMAHAKRARNGSGKPPLFRTLKRGLGELTGRLGQLAAPSTTVLRGEAETILRDPAGYAVRVNGETITAAHIVLACPAYSAAALLETIGPELARLLNAVEYSSSLTLSLAYDKATFGRPLNGFGFLVPRRERNRLVACTWVANKFSHRVPEDMVVLRCFFGGAGDDAILAEPDEELLRIARQELRRIMKVSATPVFHHIARWPRSMAQYTVGHQDRLKKIQQHVAAAPGLHLAGNAYIGIGIPDCIKMGREAAHRIAASEPNRSS